MHCAARLANYDTAWLVQICIGVEATGIDTPGLLARNPVGGELPHVRLIARVGSTDAGMRSL
jgi:hypothetical protein